MKKAAGTVKDVNVTEKLALNIDKPNIINGQDSRLDTSLVKKNNTATPTNTFNILGKNVTISEVTPATASSTLPAGIPKPRFVIP